MKGTIFVQKKISLSTVISMIALTAALTFILTMAFTLQVFNDKVSEVDRLSDKYQRLEELDATVSEYFYRDAEEEAIVDMMLKGYIAGLDDPYSTYYTAEELEAYEDNTAGVYVGIGVSVMRDDEGYASIQSVMSGGAAEKAGLVPGDTILSVNGISFSSDYEKAIETIRGEEGEEITLSVRKANTESTTTLKLVCAQVNETTVTAELLNNHIGYIRITKFRTVSVAQFETALHDMMAAGAKGIIFDVRDDGGGMLDALEQMMDPLLPEGELAFAYEKDGSSFPIVESDAEMLDMPYAVLMNGNTASAAELFACLLRDYADAILVGEKSFGKGIMQTTFPLSDGGVTLTTATYATGKSECYHGVGLEPDVLSVADVESQTDNQLEDAVNALLDRINSNAE